VLRGKKELRVFGMKMFGWLKGVFGRKENVFHGKCFPWKMFSWKTSGFLTYFLMFGW